jgi:hypothetical protein
MHSDGPPADLYPVQDKVVVLAAYLGGATNMEWKGEPHKFRSNVRGESSQTHGGDHQFAHLRNASVIQRLDILPSWRSKRMVRATPSSFCECIFFCISTREQRKFGDPKKVRATRWGIDPCAV